MSKHEEGKLLSENLLTLAPPLTILPIDLLLEIYSYCNLDDLRNLMITSKQFYELLQSSPAFRVWMIQLDKLLKNMPKKKKKSFKNESFKLLDSDFEAIGKNESVMNRTTVLMKVIRKQLQFYITKLILRSDNMLELFHKHPRYFEDYREVLQKKLFHITHDTPSSYIYLLEYDPFFMFKHPGDSTNLTFLLAFCKFLYLVNYSNLQQPTQFIQTWKQMPIDQLEPNVKIWKEFYKKRFKSRKIPCYIAYFHLPYQLHDGEYKTANEINRLECKSSFMKEFECMNEDFKQLIDPLGGKTLGFQHYYFYMENLNGTNRLCYLSSNEL